MNPPELIALDRSHVATFGHHHFELFPDMGPVLRTELQTHEPIDHLS